MYLRPTDASGYLKIAKFVPPIAPHQDTLSAAFLSFYDSKAAQIVCKLARFYANSWRRMKLLCAVEGSSARHVSAIDVGDVKAPTIRRSCHHWRLLNLMVAPFDFGTDVAWDVLLPFLPRVTSEAPTKVGAFFFLPNRDCDCPASGPLRMDVRVTSVVASVQ